MSEPSPMEQPVSQPEMGEKKDRMISAIAWLATVAIIVTAAWLAWRIFTQRAVVQAPRPAAAASEPTAVSKSGPDTPLPLPKYNSASLDQAIFRLSTIHTTIPQRSSETVSDYTVEKGDSIFGIAKEFKIKPETILWSNYDVLNDNPDTISLGMQLHVPPTDGVYYKWQDGDTLKGVADRFGAKVDAILNWLGNNLDLVNPQVAAGVYVMIPGGHREFKQWIMPTIPRGPAGVNKSIFGAGACDTSTAGAMGTGSFIWPAGNHFLSGNDYWSGHLGIDIAAGEGAPIFAADSGVVVYSGWSDGGYGNMIMIDHGNGYQTLYAHLSVLGARCGSSVSKGQTIGSAGSTGNSTGAHLHFEVRYQGGFVSPWYVLPAP